MQALAVFALLASLVLAQASNLRGVNPDLVSHYSGGGGTFACISGIPKTVPFSRVNDNYCDCPDGSDEPGTSACHNGRFYCRNLGHEPRLLASAFVDDGVCDCCDGSDELKGTCQNTCLQAAAVKKEALRSKIQLHELMLKTKKDYASKASSFKDELKLKAQTIDEDIARHQAEVENLKGEVTRLEAEEAAEEAARQAELAAANQALEEARKAEEEQQAVAHSEARASAQGEEAAVREDGQGDVDGGEEAAQPEEREETPEERGRRIASQWTNDPEAAAVPDFEDHVNEDEHEEEEEGQYDNGGDDGEGHFDYPPADEAAPPQYEHHRRTRPEGSTEAAEHSEPSEWEDLLMFLDVLRQWATRWMRTLAKVLREGIREDVLAHREKLKQRSRARLPQQDEKLARPTRQPRQRSAKAVASSSSAAAAVLADPTTPLGQARSAVFNAERTLQQLQKDKENIGNYLHRQLDFGPDDIFLALANKCFSSYQTRWTYEICMFDKATQKEGYTNSVNVGKWYGFSPDYKTMYFTGGDECWNVGPRSMTVTLSCGYDERLSDGEEPSTCAYSAKLTTPAVCTEAELAALQQELDNLEAFEKEVQAQILKDEL